MKNILKTVRSRLSNSFTLLLILSISTNTLLINAVQKSVTAVKKKPVGIKKSTKTMNKNPKFTTAVFTLGRAKMTGAQLAVLFNSKIAATAPKSLLNSKVKIPNVGTYTVAQLIKIIHSKKTKTVQQLKIKELALQAAADYSLLAAQKSKALADKAKAVAAQAAQDSSTAAQVAQAQAAQQAAAVAQQAADDQAALAAAAQAALLALKNAVAAQQAADKEQSQSAIDAATKAAVDAQIAIDAAALATQKASDSAQEAADLAAQQASDAKTQAAAYLARLGSEYTNALALLAKDPASSGACAALNIFKNDYAKADRSTIDAKTLSAWDAFVKQNQTCQTQAQGGSSDAAGVIIGSVLGGVALLTTVTALIFGGKPSQAQIDRLKNSLENGTIPEPISKYTYDTVDTKLPDNLPPKAAKLLGISSQATSVNSPDSIIRTQSETVLKKGIWSNDTFVQNALESQNFKGLVENNPKALVNYVDTLGSDAQVSYLSEFKSSNPEAYDKYVKSGGTYLEGELVIPGGIPMDELRPSGSGFSSPINSYTERPIIGEIPLF